ncbi:MAG: NAD(P)H-dependent oxidoreductase [Candidatus Thorarchaeota archaeon]
MTTSSIVHVLGIVGSPRRGGNTETLVDEVLRGAVECGASSKKVFLSDLDIAPCQACDNCRESGDCIHDDDMKNILALMEKSDVWVFGSPVYWWGPTAQFKAFLDRWYGVKQSIFQGKKVLLTIPMGGSDDYYARHTVGIFEDISKYLGMELVEVIVAPGMRGLKTASENGRYLKLAREAVSI